MNTAATTLTALVALAHVWFLILEMFLWTKPAGLKAFGMKQAQADATATLAANQGLYNGFLAAALVLGLVLPDASQARALQIYGLGSVIAAGLYGAYSVSRKIFFVQALPAIVALALVLAS
jgi:putative membrane protein